MKLDQAEQYYFHDRNEISWRFLYTDVGGVFGWWAFMKRPGGPEICIGKISERELAKKLEETPPLSNDDLIDLELWLQHDGIKDYAPKKEEKKPEIKE